MKALERCRGYVDDNEQAVVLKPRYKADLGIIMTLINRIAHKEVILKINKK